MQNAEDAQAKSVEFRLLADRLDIYHNGIDFDFKDIDGVTGIGISRKKDDLNSIGKFGVGFKSVFAVTKTPYIFSGDYAIKIEDFVVPSMVTAHESVEGTLISLPFNHDVRLREEVFALVSRKLENIGLKTLLFLNNIEEIIWEAPVASGHYLKSLSQYNNANNAKKVTIISARDIEEYIVLERPIKIDSKPLSVAVACRLGRDDNGKEIVVREPDSKLVVFFPTEKVTFLNFLIQGPYKTTPNRENIPLNDDQNKLLIDETAELIRDSLSVIKTLGYLDINFLNVLPIEHKEKEIIYSALYSKVREQLLTDEELLPTFDGGYTKSSDALLARGKGLTEFLKPDDIEMLFARRRWLDTDITSEKSKVLRDFLTNDLEIDEVDFEDFAKKITSDFLRRKPDEWVIDLYGRLLDQQALWRDNPHGPKAVLRGKPIIRLESAEHIAPYDDSNEVQAYLPSDTKSEYRTVKRVLADNEDALKFLKDLGLKKPDIFAEVREFILPKYQKPDVIRGESYFDDFGKLLTAYETIASSKKNDFVQQMAEGKFVDSYSRVQGDTLCYPSNTYLKEAKLLQYFDNDETICFVADELYEKFGEDRLKPFLMELGVEDKPRRIVIDAALSWEEKSEIRVKFQGYSNYTREICCNDYEYSNLQYVLEHITPESSYTLWELLLKSIEKLRNWEVKQFFQGEYRWKYYSEHATRFDASFLKRLLVSAWLVNTEGVFQKSSDLTLSQLSDGYTKDSPNVGTLLDVLRFKPDAIDRLPEEYKTKLDLIKDYSLEDLQRLILERQEET